MTARVCIKCKHYESEDGACYCPSFLKDRDCRLKIKPKDNICANCHWLTPANYCTCKDADEYLCTVSDRYYCKKHKKRESV